MPSPNNYCYQTTWGFQTCNVNMDPTPDTYIKRWTINQTEADLIANGGVVEVADGKLVITAPVVGS